MTAYLLIGVLVAVGAWGVWMYRRGRQAQQIDVMQEINDDARKATALRGQIDKAHADDVRAALARRVRRPF